jgi:hypothetical protein
MLADNFTARNPNGLPRQSRTTEPDDKRSVVRPNSNDKRCAKALYQRKDLNAGRSIPRSRKTG